jgi:sugar lactone lactonase YvrE
MKCTKPLLLLFTAILAFSACKKDPVQPVPTPNPPGNPTPVNPPPPAPAQLSITSFSPTSAAKDSVITINGKGFSTTTTGNTVTINGMAATIVTATTDVLTVKVPVHAGTGVLQVQVGSQTAGATPAFQYIYTVSTIAGDGSIGFKDGPGNQAEFNNSYGLAVDAAGNIYVADALNSRIRKIAPTVDHTVSTLAGDGTRAFKEGNGTNAEFYNPAGVAVTANGVVYVADGGNSRIRKIAPNGDVSTIAGDGIQGFRDGAAAQAEFKTSQGIALDAAGNIYVADTYNSSIRKIAPDGTVSTLAGNGTFGDQEGNGAAARFDNPQALTLDAAGFIYVADQLNNRVKKINPAGDVINLAGDGNQGFVDGPGPQARFIAPNGIVDAGHGYILVTDFLNFRIREISPTGQVFTIAGSGTEGFKDGVGPVAEFSNPTGIAVDAQGNIYVMDAGNFRVRKIE